MKRLAAVIMVFALAALLALAGTLVDSPKNNCIVDGTPIESITKVAIKLKSGDNHKFCSVCCARKWLAGDPENPQQAASVTVTDEIAGVEIDGSLAYWIESDFYSRRENRCRVHVFKDVADASKHIQRYRGRETPAYLAGMGRRLPWAADFNAQDIAGIKYRLTRYRGQVVFLRFWNSGNPFTRIDLEYLSEAYRRWHEKGFTVLAVNVEEDPGRVKNFTEDFDLPFPVLLDPQGRIADAYDVSGFPTGYLLDRAGIIRERIIGEILPDAMEPLLNLTQRGM